MDVHFSSDSWLITTLVIMAVTTVPVKIGAQMFGARNNKFSHCGIAVALGTLAAVVLFHYVGGFTALALSFIAISVIYWQVLQISFAWSFLFTIVVIIIQFITLQVLSRLSLLLLG